MPTGYAGEGKTYSKTLGRWVKKEKTQAFDYEGVNKESAALLISMYRWYPDWMADDLRSPNATYKLELPQRFMMRTLARDRYVYITGSRGLTKTFCIILTVCIEGILFPGIIVRYAAPEQKQAAALATQAFKQIEKDYPIIAGYWKIKNDREDMFRIETDYGSQFTMYAVRGDNAHQVIGEEIGAEGRKRFDIDTFGTDIDPVCRLDRIINQQKDPTFIHKKHQFISNACSRQNEAFTKYRKNALDAMLYGGKHAGFCCDISWVTSLLCNIRDIEYIKDQMSTLSEADKMREFGARYTGTGEDPLISDEVLAKSKQNPLMEYRHCGDPNAIYIVAHDVSYAEGRRNAKCADVVLKLTPYDSEIRRDKYLKQVVYADNYAPPATDYLQAQKLKQLWSRYCMNGGQTTYLVVDAQAYGTSVVEELMKPTNDGLPTLCCMNHAFPEIEQQGALPVIYPLKAGSRGTADEEGAMIRYAQKEFEQGNVQLLIDNVQDGINAYKDSNRIKNNLADGKIAHPYQVCRLLCQQIANLRTRVSGLTLKEERRSKYIQRDIWSALKYALRMACMLEEQLVSSTYRAKSSWSRTIENARGAGAVRQTKRIESARSRLLALRKGKR